MHPWYIRRGAVRIASAVVAVYVAITSVIRLLTEQGSVGGLILNLFGTLIGVAALAAVLLSVRADRRSASEQRSDGSTTTSGGS